MSNPTIFGGLIRAAKGVKLPDKNKVGLQGVPHGTPDSERSAIQAMSLIQRRRAEGWTPGHR